MGDYVPFYFAPRSPMLYAISRGSVEGYADGQKPVIYLCSTAEAIRESGLSWVFTEGHADMDYTDYFDDLRDLDKIDWKLMEAKYWNDTDEDPDRKRRRQAEFLVYKFVPLKMVSYIGVFDRAIVETVRDMVNGPAIGLQRGWYF